MSLKSLRDPVYRILDPATRWLIRMGVHPNAISILGVVATLGAGYLYHEDHVRTAGLFVLLGGLFDIFDGRVARESEKASRFGSFFDSTLDRFSEIIVFIGLLSLYNTYGTQLADIWMIYVILLAAGGSLMVSYTRAKAEALGIPCTVGFMQRAERIVLLGLGSILFGLAWNGAVLSWIIVILAVTTNYTAFQRIWWVYRYERGLVADAATSMEEGGPDRGKPVKEAGGEGEAGEGQVTGRDGNRRTERGAGDHPPEPTTKTGGASPVKEERQI
ncbi:MAG: CDP-alcohol phosphatidyltransferase family protein [Gemmatimonadota bacterium]